MILITGAAGKTGRSIIQALNVKGEAIRALVFREGHIQKVKTLGATEVIIGDLRDQYVMEQAVRGIRAIYHICPNILPDEVVIGHILINAARSAGVELFVYHSVLHPQIETMPHHWHKLHVEELLFQSGLPCIILQPAVYMQNILTQWDQILEQGSYVVPYAVETKLSLVDLDDVAQVAATVLTESGHIGATYELAGTEALSQINLAQILSRQLGFRVDAKTMSLKAWVRQARIDGLGHYQIETLTKIFQYYECYGMCGNPHILGWLLSRPPTTFADFVAREQLRCNR